MPPTLPAARVACPLTRATRRLLLGLALGVAWNAILFAAPQRQTTVSIAAEDFLINGRPAYAQRTWQGRRIEGLLLNARLVQGIFDDRNPATVTNWAYADTGRWDAGRNTREFLAAMPEWRQHGLLALTINLQGGSPQGYSRDQPWHNSAINADGSLRADYLARLERILDRADELGMAVILGVFYFGQDQRLQDEAAVVRAVDHTVQWLFARDYRHVLVEINNECNVSYDHAILRPERVHELIERVKAASRDGRRLLVSTSYGGGTIPGENVVRSADFLLLHGNGVGDPARISEMVRRTRGVPGYAPKPILFNEDDHFDFEQPTNNFTAALDEHASWGCFDYRMRGEGFDEGYQSVPVNWRISSARKRGFFNLLAAIAGAAPSPAAIDLTRTNYHGWTNAIRLRSRAAEVVVVPAVGRVMQFRLTSETENPFWENRALDGQPPDPRADVWGNFGGDKTWPAPQTDWPQVTPRAWPPPQTFDSMPVEATIEGNAVLLVSPVDPHYGIRTRRRIALDPEAPRLTIATEFEKVAGPPRKVGVWVITQLADPVAVVMPVPLGSPFAKGYNRQSERLPQALKRREELLTLTRGRKVATKIGNDAGTLIWVGAKTMLRIDSPREPGAEYPDQGSSAEVYTNPDPLPYVELELLGPLHTMKPGDRIQRTSTYTLHRRQSIDPAADAQRLLAQ